MFKLRFETGNAAFEDSNKIEEIAAILHDISEKVFNGQTAGKIRDTNGNTIGEFSLT